jgi:hypothetical protein
MVAGKEQHMASPLSRRWALYAGVGAALAILATAAAVPAATAGTTATAGAAAAPGKLSAAPLGVNVAPWDYAYSARGSVDAMQPLLKAAGIDQLRYGGGSTADYYDWQTNTDIGNCLPDNPTASFTSSCASADPLDFAQFSRQARAIGASSFVTVNYGSGTPAEAAAWVKQATRTAGDAVALWEIGNEEYGCWEVDNELAGPPERYSDYVEGIDSTNGSNPTCPMVTEGLEAGTKTMATSYAVNAKRFLIAMRSADPGALIGVPWAFSSTLAGGSVADYTEWNNVVLETDAKYVSFVDAHYYPFGFSGSTGGSHPTDEQVLQSLLAVPSLYSGIRAELNVYDPRAGIVIGETGVSHNTTTTSCTPVGALFAAGDLLSWLAAGAQSVDWWDLNNYGNTGSRCVNPDSGLFTSSAKPVAETPYYGYLLASLLAQPHAQLKTLDTSDPADVLAYQSVLPDGKHAVAFINTNTSAAEPVTFQSPLSGTLQTWLYRAGNQNPANSKIVTGTASAASVAAGLTLPPESMTILMTRLWPVSCSAGRVSADFSRVDDRVAEIRPGAVIEGPAAGNEP